MFVCLTETNINHYDGIVSVWLLGKKLGVCIGYHCALSLKKIQFILSVPDYSIDNEVDYNIIIDLIVNSKVHQNVLLNLALYVASGELTGEGRGVKVERSGG